MLYRGNQNYFLDSALRSNGGQQKEDWQKKVVFVSSETIWRWGGLTPHPTHWLLLLAYLPLFPVDLTLSFKSLNKGSHQGLNTSTVIALVIISFQSWLDPLSLSLSLLWLSVFLLAGWIGWANHPPTVGWIEFSTSPLIIYIIHYGKGYWGGKGSKYDLCHFPSC